MKEQDKLAWIEELATRESSNNLKEFVHLLWCINSKFIRTFAPGDKDYIQEQLSVQNCILNIVKTQGRPKSVAMQDHDNKEEVLVNLLKRARATSYPAASRFIYYKIYISAPGAAVCRSQILMTKTVIASLKSCYKTHNLEKWQALFTKDGEFIKALVRIRCWDSYGLSAQRSFYFKFFGKKDKLPSFQPLLQQLENWIDPSSKDPDEFYKSHVKFFKTTFPYKVTETFDLLWKINSRFIESLGYHPNEPVFLHEQSEVQQELIKPATKDN
ncbi:hypothetical protein PSTG_00081 [Puccinia striiformis f. sp. tritici PST-78]|uniref:Uncharacterized protein n=1 Tax=Puccinia striiformis f. sp. tritici PST-78 TaxID=1165861 RepID=A0A0L0W5G4_9BASI|nr:hypothetical protein PSTG_00081 [Puccinia striiformis f. sp. tritici PST-78]